MNKLPSLSLFFPACNERDNVVPLTEEALQILPMVADRYEVIIVDDGSTDGTSEIAELLAQRHPHIVRAVHNHPNLGYGGALKRGFAEARYGWIFFTDGDRQFGLDELPKLVERAGSGNDMVIGYRLNRSDPPHRLLNATMYGAMIKFLFKIRARDIDCAYKLIGRSVLQAITLESDGALISAELLIKARNCGFSWDEVGVHHYPRRAGTQTGANLRVILRMFGELFGSYRRLKSYGRSATEEKVKLRAG